jgi:hypothetical protein
MMRKGALVIAAIIVVIAITVGLYASGMDDQITMRGSGLGGGGGGLNPNTVDVVIESDGAWSAEIKDSESESHSVDGFGDRTISITCRSDGTYSLTIQKTDGRSDTLNVQIVTDETDGSSSSQRSRTTSASGIISLSGTC